MNLPLAFASTILVTTRMNREHSEGHDDHHAQYLLHSNFPSATGRWTQQASATFHND